MMTGRLSPGVYPAGTDAPTLTRVPPLARASRRGPEAKRH